jgi:hypothetical protein
MRPFAPSPNRRRPAMPHCRGGASSLLRLANPAAGRLPSSAALGDWVGRAAQALPPDDLPAAMVAPAADAISPLFTRLWPRSVVGVAPQDHCPGR